MTRPTTDRRSFMQASGALLGAATLGHLGTGAAAASGSTVRTTGGETEPRYEMGEAESFTVDVEIENSDGEAETATLYGEIIRPVDGGEVVDDVPVILTYSPYNDLYQALNGGDSPALDGIAEFFVPRGYARAQFDLIGTRNSSGYYDYGGIRERLSTKELVDGLGEMEWTNGNVGMIGGSYDGTTQFAGAVETPEHLEAIIPQVAIDRWYDYRHFAGVPRSTVGTPTLFDFGFALLPPAAVEYPVATADALATRVNWDERAEYELRSYEYDSVYDDFWVERDYRRLAENVDCAVMIVGGWEDRNVIRWGSTRFYEALPDDVDKRLVMGDWPHSAGQYGDIWDLRHAFYDRYLMDDVKRTGIESLPDVDVQSESSPRTQYRDWPPNSSKRQTFPLVASDPGQGELGLVGTEDPTFQDTSPGIAEADMFSERSSGEQHLMFETPELDSTVRFTGRVTADLLLESTDDTWGCVAVYERGDDGVRVFSRGFHNSRFREGVSDPSATPSEPYRLPVECWDINWTVEEGNRLGVVVSSDNEDHTRHDPTNESTNRVVLEGSQLSFDGYARGVTGSTFPNAWLNKDHGGQTEQQGIVVYQGGSEVNVSVTLESASRPVRVRDPLPDGWEVVDAGDHEVREVDGTTYVVSREELQPGETLEYTAQVPDSTAAPAPAGEGSMPAAEYTKTGTIWQPDHDTSRDLLVVGTGV